MCQNNPFQSTPLKWLHTVNGKVNSKEIIIQQVDILCQSALRREFDFHWAYWGQIIVIIYPAEAFAYLFHNFLFHKHFLVSSEQKTVFY